MCCPVVVRASPKDDEKTVTAEDVQQVGTSAWPPAAWVQLARSAGCRPAGALHRPSIATGGVWSGGRA